MQNTLKILSINFSVIFIFLHLTSSEAFAVERCNVSQLKKKLNVRDAICDSDGTSFTLNYSAAKRVIWLDSNNQNYRQNLYRLDKNAAPELVGAEDEIKFITRSSITKNGRRYLGLTFSERSMRGNGMGQCGAGSEVYFLAMEINNSWISTINKFKVQSCIDAIDISLGTTDYGESISITKNEMIMFHWLNYPEFENPVTGIYDFSTNKLKVKENVHPYEWVAF